MEIVKLVLSLWFVWAIVVGLFVSFVVYKIFKRLDL